MTDRRTFLKKAGAAASAAAVGACGPETETPSSADRSTFSSGTLLEAVGEAVLPEELGGAGREAAVQAFRRWARDYRPVPELNHGYGTSEIRYGPPHPVPGWQAQLEALDVEARKRHGVGFAALQPEERRGLVRRHIGEEGSATPDPLRARHVAVALLGHWLSTPDATDRCYGVRILARTCRGLEGSSVEPEGLT